MAELLRRIGVVGDVHGEAKLFAAALERLRAAGVERTLVVGDIVDGGEDPAACCRMLDAADVVAVRGNHDRWLLAGEMRSLPEATHPGELDAHAAEVLGSLPATVRLETVAGPLLLCHGLGEDDMATLLPEDDGRALADNRALATLVASDLALVVHGHTHKRMVRSLGSLTIINAGTLHRPHGPSFAIVDLVARRVDFSDWEGEALTRGPTYRFGLPGQDLWDAWGGVGSG